MTKQRWAAAAATVLGLGATEALLRRALADGRSIESLLAPGPHSSLGALGAALLFLGVRVALYVGLPALGGAALAIAIGRWPKHSSSDAAAPHRPHADGDPASRVLR